MRGYHKGKRARAGSLALVDYIYKCREPASPVRVWFVDVMARISLVLRLICFGSFFVFMLSLKPRPFFVQSFFDMQAL